MGSVSNKDKTLRSLSGFTLPLSASSLLPHSGCVRLRGTVGRQSIVPAFPSGQESGCVRWSATASASFD
jgi:hypothetical protein